MGGDQIVKNKDPNTLELLKQRPQQWISNSPFICFFRAFLLNYGIIRRR